MADRFCTHNQQSQEEILTLLPQIQQYSLPITSLEAHVNQRLPIIIKYNNRPTCQHLTHYANRAAINRYLILRTSYHPEDTIFF